MHLIVIALLIGIIAGLRAFTAPAAVSWAAKFHRSSSPASSWAVSPAQPSVSA